MTDALRRPARLHFPFPEGGNGREYLIYSYKWGCWHRRSDDGQAAGYTRDIAKAGVFDRAKARVYHDETVTKISERDNAAVHVRDQIAAMDARVAELRAEADRAAEAALAFKAALPITADEVTC